MVTSFRVFARECEAKNALRPGGEALFEADPGNPFLYANLAKFSNPVPVTKASVSSCALVPFAIHGSGGAFNHSLHGLTRLPLRQNHGSVDMNLDRLFARAQSNGIFAVHPLLHALDLRLRTFKRAV
jgi:hypothetical protein